MQLVIAQGDFLVGDIEGNCDKVLSLSRDALESYQADLVVFPELALSGFPAGDLTLRPSLNSRIKAALERLQRQLPVAVVVGYPAVRRGMRVNVAGFIAPGEPLQEYAKQHLSAGRVFSETRYFKPGNAACLVDYQGVRFGLSIGKDVLHQPQVEACRQGGADFLINLSASPFRQDKHQKRLQQVTALVKANTMPLVVANLVGGQDELVFDGASYAMSATGELVAQSPFFTESLSLITLEKSADEMVVQGDIAAAPQGEAAVWQALVLGLRDYVRKNGFDRAVLGLSGGIDSALVLALAVEALGASNVQAVMMPYHYTAKISLEDAEAQASTLGVDYHVMPIANIVESIGDQLAPLFAGSKTDTTEENLQARCRGTLLMAISNKKGAMVLATGNKSEMAVGYCTLYGDMVGGYAVLKDVAKTQVYRLARYCNSKNGKVIIPERVITRPPSAELAPDQKDQDSLPDYDVLDAILHCYVERDMSAEATIRAGFDRDVVYRVVQLVDRNEYKRSQSAPGPRITERTFGSDRRYPITNGWRPGD